MAEYQKSLLKADLRSVIDLRETFKYWHAANFTHQGKIRCVSLEK